MAYTSRVFASFRWVLDALRAQEWPSHPFTNEKPTVDVGDEDFVPSEDGAETVGVILRVEDDALIERKRIGGSQQRDEQFECEVVIRSYVPGRSRGEVFDRLEELADVVQGCVLDHTTNTVTPVGEAQWSAKLGGVSRVTFRLAPSPDEGWIGVSSVQFVIHSRI